MKKVLLFTILFLEVSFIFAQTENFSESILKTPSLSKDNFKIEKMALSNASIFNSSFITYKNFNFNDRLHKELNSSILAIYTFNDLFQNSNNLFSWYNKPVSKVALEGLNEALFYKNLFPRELELLYR